NWLTTRQAPPTCPRLRFILPASSSNTRSLATFWASLSASRSSSSGFTPSSTTKPRPMAPTRSPATRTSARATRCTRALTRARPRPAAAPPAPPPARRGGAAPPPGARARCAALPTAPRAPARSGCRASSRAASPAAPGSAWRPSRPPGAGGAPGAGARSRRRAPPRPPPPARAPAPRSARRRCAPRRGAPRRRRSEETTLFGGVDHDGAVLGRQRVQHAFQLLHVVPGEPLGRAALAARVAQQVGGVEEGEDLDAVPLVPAAAGVGDALLGAQEPLGGHVAERRDDLRLHELDLLQQHRLAGRDLLGLGVAVAGRAELDDVGDVDRRTGDVDRLEDLVEQLTG